MENSTVVEVENIGNDEEVPDVFSFIDGASEDLLIELMVRRC